jgi:hypothetical protein
MIILGVNSNVGYSLHLTTARSSDCTADTGATQFLASHAHRSCAGLLLEWVSCAIQEGKTRSMAQVVWITHEATSLLKPIKPMSQMVQCCVQAALSHMLCSCRIIILPHRSAPTTRMLRQSMTAEQSTHHSTILCPPAQQSEMHSHTAPHPAAQWQHPPSIGNVSSAIILCQRARACAQLYLSQWAMIYDSGVVH